jgi:hypothetical protein
MTELARLIDIDQGLLSKIERGLRPPPEIVPYVQRMATRFGLEPNSKEYSELLQVAYRERFPEQGGGGGRILTLGLPDRPLDPGVSRGLGGLPLEDTHPDSPAGRYYRSQGYRVGQNCQRPGAADAPPGDPSSGRSLPASLAGCDAATAQGWIFQLLSSMGVVVTKLEQAEQTWRLDLCLPDASEYELVLRSKTQRKGKEEDPPGPRVEPKGSLS